MDNNEGVIIVRASTCRGPRALLEGCGEEENLTLALEQQECEEEERWVVEKRRLAEERRVAKEKAKKEAECQGNCRSYQPLMSDKVKYSRRYYIKYNPNTVHKVSAIRNQHPLM